MCLYLCCDIQLIGVGVFGLYLTFNPKKVVDPFQIQLTLSWPSSLMSSLGSNHQITGGIGHIGHSYSCVTLLVHRTSTLQNKRTLDIDIFNSPCYETRHGGLPTRDQDKAIIKLCVFALICRFLGYKSQKTYNLHEYISISYSWGWTLSSVVFSCDQMTRFHNQLICNSFLITKTLHSTISGSWFPIFSKEPRELICFD